jgi:hypothetical protein
MTIRLLVAEGAATRAQGLPPGARLVGATTAGAVLVLGAVAAKDDANADAAAASTAPPFTFSLEDMLPHGLAVVGCVKGWGAPPNPTSTWVTLDPSTGEFFLAGAPATPTVLPAMSARSSTTALSLPPNDAFALVRVSMPRLRVDGVEELLDGSASSSLLFASASAGGLVLSAAAGGGDATAEATTASQLDGATFEPLVDTSSGATTSTSAPVFEYDEEGASPPTTVLLDALAVVPASTPVSQLARDHLVPALKAQLRVAKRVLSAAGKGLKQQREPRAAHFAPPSLGGGFPVTLLYPTIVDDESKLSGVRRAAHATLGLPMDRPLLRLANAVVVAGTAPPSSPSSAATTTTKKLLNVHESIPTPPPLSGPNVTTSLVQGDYEYCHYLQDGTKDAGWGCAYRSCQTLCSWFRLQRLASLPNNPSHSDIQKILLKLGDKPASFVNSNQWIGAIELGYVLDELLGVQCRIVTAARGDEVPSKARQLALHFKEHGSPVMVGGGVLAYTLLGVQFDEETGDAAFLILDPHYTGGDSPGDDLEKKIVGGGWVGWKKLGDKAAAGGELFVADAFYNFLCPMRPREV